MKKLLIVMLLLSTFPASIQSQGSTIAPKLLEIQGNSIGPGIYDGTIRLIYGGDHGVVISLVVDGSGYNNETLEMVFSYENSTLKVFYLDITLTGFTTFYGIDDLGGIEDFSNELDVNFNRVWTIDEGYPELVAVENSTLVSNQYLMKNNEIGIEYRIKSSQANISLISGIHRELMNDLLPMSYTHSDNGYRYFNTNMTINTREKWITGFSDNSYEYDKENPLSFLSHRIFNGFKVNQTLPVVLENGLITDKRITEEDNPVLMIELLNMTGNEGVTAETIITGDLDGDLYIPVENNVTFYSTSTINTTSSSIYLVEVGRQDWGKEILFIITINDTSSGLAIENFEIKLLVGKWGPIAYFEKEIMYTKSPSVVVHFVINDIDDVGIDSIFIFTSHGNISVTKGVFNATVELKNFGHNEVILNVTNNLNESEIASLTVIYDITPPKIDGAKIVEEADRFRLLGTISDNLLNDSGLSKVVIEINGVHLQITREFGDLLELNEILPLNMGLNEFNITATDKAGNVGYYSFVFKISSSTTSEGNFPLVGFSVFIIFNMIWRRRN